MQACHDSIFSGHFGTRKTQHLLERLFYWPSITKDVKLYVRTCDTCARVKASTQKPTGPLRPLEVPEGKWTHITVDMVTELPTSPSGHDAILVFVDRFTKMTHLVPTTTTLTAPKFVELLEQHIFRLHGWPKLITTDRGSVFCAQFSRAFLELNGMLAAVSSAYHPQTDGQTERMNRVMEDVLRAYVGHKQEEWERHLPMVEFAINNSVADGTNTSPFLLNYGVNPRHPELAKLVELKVRHGTTAGGARAQRDQLNALHLYAATLRFCDPSPTLPDLHRLSQHSNALELYAAAFRRYDVPAVTKLVSDMDQAILRTKLYLQAAQQRMKHFADRRRSDTVPFKVGDKVLLSTKNLSLHTNGCRKLMPRFVGPFTITRQVNPVAFQLELPSTMRIHNVFHSSLLRPCPQRDPSGADGPVGPTHPAPLIIDGHEEFEVERILDCRDKVVRTKRRGNSNQRARTTKREYLVQWAGYGPEHNQWRPITSLANCHEAILDYHARTGTTADAPPGPGQQPLPRPTDPPPQPQPARRRRGSAAAATLWCALVPFV
jgi:hypothetical protein